MGVLFNEMGLAHSEGCRLRPIPNAYLVVDVSDVTLDRALTKHQRLGYLTIGHTLGKELQGLPLPLCQV